jgi:hypothetical protein
MFFKKFLHAGHDHTRLCLRGGCAALVGLLLASQMLSACKPAGGSSSSTGAAAASTTSGDPPAVTASVSQPASTASIASQPASTTSTTSQPASTAGVSSTSPVSSPAPALPASVQTTSSAQTIASAQAPAPAASDPPATVGPIIPSPANYPKFSPASFWYTPLPNSAPLDPNSANLVAEFQRQIQTYYGNVGVNTSAYSAPIYIAPANAPTQQVTVWDCHNNGWTDPQLAQQWAAVPIPSYAQPADGTDSEMSIYQPSTDTLWEFWAMQQTGTGWQACWGGRMTNVSANPGIWAKPYGASATGLPFSPGQVTVDELRSGVINHVIGIALVDAENWDKWSWPADRSDGWNPAGAPNRIYEGQRFRIDPTINIDALGLGPIATMVAKAGQKYGFVVWDKAGSISLRFENPKSLTLAGQTDPYVALFNGVPNYALLYGIPWDKLRFLPVDYGEPG